ncbi:MAG TPA: hypothetical protein VFT22_36500 [Kofleriaceae bacterium]|nr:hypothetical protein [Kofleriaceae bacterium]
MQRSLFALIIVGVATLAQIACSHSTGTSAGPADELKPLTVEQVAARIAAPDGKTFIYDDNSKESWVKGHVPGAKWLDSDHVTAADLPADHTATLIFYCHDEG